MHIPDEWNAMESTLVVKFITDFIAVGTFDLD